MQVAENNSPKETSSYTSNMEFGTASWEFLLISLFLSCAFPLSLQNESTETNTDGIKDVIDFKVSVKRLKREVRTVPDEELSPLDGRTHRASEPLDPNQPLPVVNPFGEFDTVNTIFDPSVEGDEKGNDADDDNVDEEADNPVPNDATDTTTTDGADDEGDAAAAGVDDNDDNDNDQQAEREYAAQYPYRQVTSRPYPSASGDGTPRRLYAGDHGYDRTPRQRRDVESDANQNQNPRYANNLPSRNDKKGGNPYSGPGYRMVVVGGSGKSGYQSGSRPYVDYSRDRPDKRRPPYNGVFFIDSRGRYIKVEVRHLDSTGRYHSSGRYQDAAVPRTAKYMYYNSRPVYTHPARAAGNQSSQYSEGGTPQDDYGGNQFYQTGSGSFPAFFNPAFSHISDDPNCPVMNTQVTINGLTCYNAITHLGSFLCYNYERVSTECCRSCLHVKKREQEVCEYGDRSDQCRNIKPFDCYDDRNRKICCARCRQFLDESVQGMSIHHKRRLLASRCSFGDQTPQCVDVRQRPHLCYLPDNYRLCCSSCPRIANRDTPGCKWGDQTPEVCRPFDENRNLQINCYHEAVRDICCATCKILRDRIPQQIRRCEYGDQPFRFRTERGILNCREFIRQYGSHQCKNYKTSKWCCYTCHRFRSRARQNK